MVSCTSLLLESWRPGQKLMFDAFHLFPCFPKAQFLLFLFAKLLYTNAYYSTNWPSCLLFYVQFFYFKILTSFTKILWPSQIFCKFDSEGHFKVLYQLHEFLICFNKTNNVMFVIIYIIKIPEILYNIDIISVGRGMVGRSRRTLSYIKFYIFICLSICSNICSSTIISNFPI